MESGSVFPSRTRRQEFFDRLNALIEEFPEIREFMVKSWEDQRDSFDDLQSIEQDYVPFSRDSPTIIQGLAVVVSYRNMDWYEDLVVLDPFDQSAYMTEGILGRAARLYLDD